MIHLLSAASELQALLPHYDAVDPSDERFLFFKGLLAKAADSLTAVNLLLGRGAVWPVHCRWIIEAFATASALNAEASFLAKIKRQGARTFLLASDIEDAKRQGILDNIGTCEPPNVEILLTRFEKRLGAKEVGLLYKVYRLLCEHTHIEYFRTTSYPKLGPEDSETLEQRKGFFLKVATACSLSLPCFAHCPPTCGFDNEHFEKAAEMSRKGWDILHE